MKIIILDVPRYNILGSKNQLLLSNNISESLESNKLLTLTISFNLM